MNKTQLRPTANVVISKSTAKDFIQNVQPSLENLIAKFYEISPTSSEYTGYTANIGLGDFFNQFMCQTCEPTAMLGFISPQNGKTPHHFTTKNSSNSSSPSGGGGQSSENDLGNSEIMGTAVFKYDKLVGELSSEETLYHLLLRNDIESCHISIPHFDEHQQYLDLYVYHKSKPKIKVEFINGTPFIHVDLNLETKILSLDDTLVNMSEKTLQKVSLLANQYIQTQIERFLYRTSTEFQSDIVGFGKYALSHFSTTQEFESYQWTENYKNSFFDVTVSTNVQSAFLLSGK